MYVRKKISKSGLVSVQIIDKSTGRYRVVKTIGSSTLNEEIHDLVSKGKDWIKQKSGLTEFDFDKNEEQLAALVNSIESLRMVGVDLLLGKIFDEIGYNQIKDTIFKHLVLYRLVYPTSKLKTTEYLYRYQQIDWDENKVYRYLDKLHSTQRELIQNISYAHTVKILQGNPQVIFYDVTTIYFEIEDNDELRQTGFSKEGKHSNPQIVLGLLVSQYGYPLAYDIFEGSKFEGHTLMPIVNHFKQKYNLEKLVIVADAGLLSNININQLITNGFEFILGARIKNESQTTQKQILSKPYKNGQTRTFIKPDKTKLIISYSEKRGHKDASNRERGLKRLEKQLHQGKLTKSNINNKGYNKYLKLTGRINISIDYKKFETDKCWDGLKGYVTNCQMSEDEIIKNYNHLWQIEKAFRVSKTDLRIRPIYHRIPKRIEAHICLNFAAYMVYKELERQLKEKKAGISPQKAIEIASFIFEITIQIPSSGEKISKTILKTEEQILLAQLFNF